MSRRGLPSVRVLALACGLALAHLGVSGTPQAAASGDGLAQTPPMGWNSWNSFGQAVNEDLIRRQVDALVASGMKDAGYEYVVIDGGWKTNERDADGNLQVDPSKFPSGMKALADYVHSKGLKFGLHHPVGMTDCQGNNPGTQSAPGATFAEKARHDAEQLAGWDIDYLKYDICRFEYPEGATEEEKRGINVDVFRTMASALEDTGRDIVYSICSYPFDVFQPWLWAPEFAHMWRTDWDIRPTFGSIMSIVDQQAGLAEYAGPGHWNDPDMLQVGVTTRLQGGVPIFDGVPGLTEDEAKTHFSMWAMLAAPMMAANDVSKMSVQTREILTNPSVIAVDQDPLGAQAIKVRDFGSDPDDGGPGGDPVPATFRDAWDFRGHDGEQQIAGDGTGTPAVLGLSDAAEATDPAWQPSPVADTGGQTPTVLSFDGIDDVVTVPGVDDLDLSQGFAFEAWVYQRSRTSPQRLFERGRGMQFFITRYGELKVNARDGDGMQHNSESLETIPLDTWTHVGLRYEVPDGQGRVRLFISGEEVTYRVEAALTTTTQLDGQGAGAYVGNRGQGDRPLHGLLAYARMTLPAGALDQWRTDLFPFEAPKDKGVFEVWVKALANGDRAVALLNRSGAPQQIATTADEVGMPNARRYLVRDLWNARRHVTAGDISATVRGHGVAMYRVRALGPSQRGG